mmetsp:Transcript_38237/g.64103  ORF Transcript_38237/g.64103 Transcript_38237/m.64103 type:complete len:330 (-) Transcript_38237:109-1098(-)
MSGETNKKEALPPDQTELRWPWWVTGDCCGLVCAFVTNILHFFAYYVQMKYVIGPWYGTLSYSAIGYSIVMLLAVISHNMCRFTNPGTVPLSFVAPTPLDVDTRRNYVCKRSHVIKPPTAHYCREARRVVVRMDHYCPWVNNVVGMFTQKYFLLFLLYTFLCCVFSGITLTSRAWSCSRQSRYYSRHNPKPSFCNPEPHDVILCVINFVEALLFVLFTGCMGADQFEAISKNTPYIDRLQGIKGRQRPICENLKDVFGGRFSLTWFLPLPPSREARASFNKMLYDTRAHLRKEAQKYQQEIDQAPTVQGEAVDHAGGSNGALRRRNGSG